MKEYASKHEISVCGFICPTEETRNIFNADILIFIDTINKCKYEDTNTMFVRPLTPTFILKKWNESDVLIKEIMEKVDNLI